MKSIRCKGPQFFLCESKSFHDDGKVGPILAHGFYSQVLDQRMSIIGKIRNRILMGQMRQTSDDLTEHEEQDRRAAGYIDEPKNESYLPSSVHGSTRHMAALAKNALILVLEFGCPHVFLTLICNPKWPKIMSQLLDGQTAFDRPEVTAAVFKLRLDLM